MTEWELFETRGDNTILIDRKTNIYLLYCQPFGFLSKNGIDTAACYGNSHYDTIEEFIAYIGDDAEYIVDLFKTLYSPQRVEVFCPECQEDIWFKGPVSDHIDKHIKQRRSSFIKSANKT